MHERGSYAPLGLSEKSNGHDKPWAVGKILGVVVMAAMLLLPDAVSAVKVLGAGQATRARAVLAEPLDPLLQDTELFAKIAHSCVDVDLHMWRHPTREVLQAAKVELLALKLCNDRNYPVYVVNFAYEPMVAATDSFYRPLFENMAKANGMHSFSFVDVRDSDIINLKVGKPFSIDARYEKYRGLLKGGLPVFASDAERAVLNSPIQIPLKYHGGNRFALIFYAGQVAKSKPDPDGCFAAEGHRAIKYTGKFEGYLYDKFDMTLTRQSVALRKYGGEETYYSDLSDFWLVSKDGNDTVLVRQFLTCENDFISAFGVDDKAHMLERYAFVDGAHRSDDFGGHIVDDVNGGDGEDVHLQVNSMASDTPGISDTFWLIDAHCDEIRLVRRSKSQ